MRGLSFVVVALALAACGGPPRVPDKMLNVDPATLDPETSARLTNARQDLDQSRSAVASASDRLAQARQEAKLAEADLKKAEVERDQAKKALEDAESRNRAAEARLSYTEKVVEARVASEEAAKARVELADAKVEHAKAIAVQQAKAEGASDIRTSDFTARVADTQRGVEDAQNKVRELEQQADKRKAQWEELARKAPPPTKT